MVLAASCSQLAADSDEHPCQAGCAGHLSVPAPATHQCPAPQTGYLYLSDPERLHAMMSLLGLGDAPAEGGEAGSSGSADVDSSSSGGDGGS